MATKTFNLISNELYDVSKLWYKHMEICISHFFNILVISRILQIILDTNNWIYQPQEVIITLYDNRRYVVRNDT
mgnify:CR=1 FL=1